MVVVIAIVTVKVAEELATVPYQAIKVLPRML